MKKQILLVNSISDLTVQDRSQFFAVVKDYLEKNPKPTAILHACRTLLASIRKLFLSIENKFPNYPSFQSKHAKNLSKIKKKIQTILMEDAYKQVVVCTSWKEDKVISLCKKLGYILDQSEQSHITLNKNYVMRIILERHHDPKKGFKIASVNIKSVLLKQTLVS